MSPGPSPGVPRASTVLDRTTGLAALVAVAAVVALPGWVPPWQGWLVLPLVALAGRYPLSLPTSSAESIVIGLDSSLLVLLGLSLPGRQALVLWAVALVAGELLTVKPLDTRVFNAGVATLSGGAALAVLSLVPQAARTSAAGLLVVVAAAAVYFAVDYLWSAVSIAVAERLTVATTLRSTGLWLGFACFVGVDSLGFLGAVLLTAQAWTVGLLTVPFLALLLAAHSWSQLRTSERRGSALSVATVALQHAGGTEELGRLVLEHVPLLLSAPGAHWSDGTAAPGDLVVPYPASGGDRFLVVTARPLGPPLTEADRAALQMLLGVAEQTHARLDLLRELRRSADHDPLTGLPNRAALTSALAQADSSAEPVALLFCDLDGFKQLNDVYGHAAGDALLVEVAERMRQAVRPGDLVARLGGDAFVVLLRDLPEGHVELARQVAGRLCQVLGSPYPLGRVSVSVGLCLSAWVERPDQLLGAGDRAMYAAKAAGGGQVCLAERGRPVAPAPRHET